MGRCNVEEDDANDNVGTLVPLVDAEEFDLLMVWESTVLEG